VSLLPLYALGGSLTTVAQRYLSFHFDQYTQNFYRFLAGGACLLLLVVLLRPVELRRLWRDPQGRRGLLLLTVGGLFAQALYVEGLTRTSAVLAALIGVLGVPLAAAVSALFYADERQTLRGPHFVAGAALALSGAVGLAFTHDGGKLTSGGGLYYLLGAALLGTGLTLLAKRLVVAFHPVCVVASTTMLTVPLFLLGGLLWGRLGAVGEASPVTIAVLLLSGVWGMVMGGAVFFLSMREFGVIVTRFMELSMPVFTGVLGYLLFRESLTGPQMVFAGALLVGCALVVVSRRQPESAAHCVHRIAR
jgi:drug/metabolite transporter (DMT)-like permease